MSVTHFHNTFLERSYELDGIEGIVKLYIGKPQEVSSTEWYCEFQIVGIGDEAIIKAHGFDSIQALLLTLDRAITLLRFLAGKEHKITWLGQDNLLTLEAE